MKATLDTRVEAMELALNAIDELSGFLESFPEQMPKSDALKRSIWFAGHLQQVYKLLFYILSKGDDTSC